MQVDDKDYLVSAKLAKEKLAHDPCTCGLADALKESNQSVP